MSATRTQNDKKAATVKPLREGSVVWAAIQVLDGKRTPMHPDEITAEIQKRGLAKKLDGKTPNASVAARLAVHTAQGLYFERPEKGKYLLRKGVTAKSVASSASPSESTREKASGSKGRRRKPASRSRKQAPETKRTQQQQQQPAAGAAADASTPAAATEVAATA